MQSFIYGVEENLLYILLSKIIKEANFAKSGKNKIIVEIINEIFDIKFLNDFKKMEFKSGVFIITNHRLIISILYFNKSIRL